MRALAGPFFMGRLYTIRSHDGSTLILTGNRTVQGKLDTVLEREFTRRRLPFQLADLRAGQRLQFGPLSIDAQGVYASDQQLLWEQVADLSLVKDRYLVISRMGDPPEVWQRFRIHKIPNLSILLALVQRIRSGQSEQEAGMQTLAAAYGTPTVIVQNRRKIDPLPENLEALAGEQQLGERRLDQQLGRRRFASWAAIISLVILDAICFTFDAILLKGFLSSSTSFASSTFLIDALPYSSFILIFSMIGLIPQLRHINTHTYTFEHGIVVQHAHKMPVVFRWEEVEVVWRKPTLVNRQNRSTQQYQNAYAYVLQLRDGSKHTFTRLNINQQAFSRIIQEQIVPLQLQAVIAAYQAGQTITFGPVQTSQQGIVIGSRALSWSQVRSVTLQGNQLVVFDIARRKPWRRVDAKRVPNLFLLFALADYARTGSLTASEV